MATDFTSLEYAISKCSVFIYLPIYLSPNYLVIRNNGVHFIWPHP